MLHVNWEAHPDTENVFRSLGIPIPKLVRVPLANIDLTGSIERNKRLGRRFDLERAQSIGTYVRTMTNPRLGYPVLCKQRDKLGKVISPVVWEAPGGNHRLFGCSLEGVTETIGYALPDDMDPVMILRVRSLLNKLGGQGNSKTELIALAVAFYRESRGDKSQIAKDYGISVASIDKALRAAKTSNALAGTMAAAKSFSQEALDALQPLSGNKRVLQAAAALVDEFKLVKNQITALVTRILATTSGEAKQLQTVRLYRTELRKTDAKPAAGKIRASRAITTAGTGVRRQILTSVDNLYALFQKIKPWSAGSAQLSKADVDYLSGLLPTINYYWGLIGAEVKAPAKAKVATKAKAKAKVAASGTRRKPAAKKAAKASSRRK